MHCAYFPRHLGRQITRCLIAHRQADTMQLADWAGPHPTWQVPATRCQEPTRKPRGLRMSSTGLTR
jgi:hypothetical protein